MLERLVDDLASSVADRPTVASHSSVRDLKDSARRESVIRFLRFFYWSVPQTSVTL